ncbi:MULTISPECIES: hypothetical protein [Bacillus cereus group]|uniref:hypothetical protein n=1 Tax=Bacillus cereus group TaxID=86661 RepID=UPI000169C714|nr:MULTISPECIES: hypothetical protein [Bacillus cereus group]MBR9742261.1 hypothetical protein [Bacillus paranthracis]MCU5288276.1 hypothetical protein [Bacillus paranthracis]MDX5778837.1 hypothetical protein [Bacillus cereus group sp. DSM 4312]WCA22224.1 hypothetical protein PGS39_31435 [Bacillus paranthracis]SMD69280.1 hypothetical protein BACERE00176_00030 [Bacillus paranthracis]
MKVIDVIDAVRNKEKMEDIAERLGTSKSTLGKKIKFLGYKFNNKLKYYEYIGKESEKNKIDNMLISEVIKRKGVKKSEVIQINSVKKEEVKKNNDLEGKSIIEEQVLTSEEIESLKELAKIYKNSHVNLFIDLAYLPYEGDKVKKSISVDSDLYLDFERFAERYEKKGISKNQLIELAMYDFMKKNC